LGDHDPSGLEIEESLRTKLETFSERKISWKRLAVTHDQFRRRELLGFPLKTRFPGNEGNVISAPLEIGASKLMG
jgi:hypothetical protein